MTAERKILRLGLDIGYSATKGVWEGGYFRFPSVVGYAKDLNFSLKEGNSSVGDEVEYNSKRFFVGERAKFSDFPLQLKTRDWIESDIYAALMISALKRFMEGINLYEIEKIVIVTGLPVNYMRDKEKAEQVVLRVFSSIRINPEMVKVNVIPQPFGAFFHFFFDSDGGVNRNAPHARRFGVLDIGHGTTDWILVENARNYLEKASGSVPIGTYTLYDMLCTALMNEYGLDHFTIADAEACIESKQLKVAGQIRNISHIVNNVLEQIGLRITGTVKSKWSSEGEIDLLLLEGGGAELLHHYLSSIAHSTFKAEDPQMANARGYYKRSVMLAKAAA
ncbi:MAG: ParM/StbA family protein [Alphaproteobacteria bacterium]|uniref:ParM/StbA family protein n=1 Tax=Candidatus Nitrobium versatile TaxID=2884831 RepID=A0A953M125_9BACT|nr:ParM/StbA family protein [Candidatus Nitrobium versatile]